MFSLFFIQVFAHDIIFDNDADYDDMLALFYLSRAPDVNIKAITTSSSGFGMPGNAQANMQRVAKLFGLDVPVSAPYTAETNEQWFTNEEGGYSLSSIISFPLPWRQTLDEQLITPMIDQGVLDASDKTSSDLSAPDLMKKTLEESEEPLSIVCTGPATTIALVLKKHPELESKIKNIFIMGSAYGSENGNIYDTQLTFGGVPGGCTNNSSEDMVDLWEHHPEEIQPFCRGQHVDDRLLEWNVFSDVEAWNILAPHTKNIQMHASSVDATATMYVTQQGMDQAINDYMSDESEDLKTFLHELAIVFNSTDESKWWDAQVAVMSHKLLQYNNMDDIPSDEQVCAKWNQTDFQVGAEWSTEANQYGEILPAEDSENSGKGTFCTKDTDKLETMNRIYWCTVSRNNGPGCGSNLIV
jgi:inosine-uridine nucleoside N-ribohydrolase